MILLPIYYSSSDYILVSFIWFLKYELKKNQKGITQDKGEDIITDTLF